jgi:hypothetical protein
MVQNMSAQSLYHTHHIYPQSSYLYQAQSPSMDQIHPIATPCQTNGTLEEEASLPWEPEVRCP